ncbi:hypothetical protein B0T26DRAFT_705151 [Lasiosphaeria miniovina]|uniref:Uncharacterized protein n=1 Tax=Lasiosphaeria miniovina TaxID=1954250 RepID=A0AA40AW49_9PEZI|nr:uncharacterized protein B0T26DRAFT_705151 [Lasiosphaeria miniovina]KAK0723046.1 hypothetical protein B0T26DRAFT_705151 [Lasiosphaeria miniovina]
MNALTQQTNHRINAMEQQMNQRFDNLANRFDILENRQNNFEIAGVNACLVHAHGAAVLQRPVDIQNGGDIPNFSQTKLQLYRIDDATADAIMPALGIFLASNTPLAVKHESIARKWILK